jgi:hypothetical protein
MEAGMGRAMAFAGASVVAGLGLLAAAPGVRGSEAGVPYPEGYRGWAHVKSMVIQAGHPLFDAFGGIHHVYANDVARAVLEARGSAYPDGAVLVFDLLEAPVEGGAVTEGARKVLAVMHKDRARFAATGGWGFEGWKGDTRERVVTDAPGQCFTCHMPLKDTDHVFAGWRK